MREDFAFHVLKDQYDKFLELVERCPENKRGTVPDGFNNSVHWNLGHVLISTELHVYFLSDFTQAMTFPPEYMTYFGYGTKPADWTQEPPAWETLVERLKAQPAELRAMLEGKLDQPVKDNFFQAGTFGELVVSTAAHASYHVGYVSAMLRALK